MSPDQPMPIVSEPYQPHPLQRRPRQVKTRSLFLSRDIGQRSLQFGFVPVCNSRTPVIFDKRHLGTAIDNLLRRAGQTAPHEAGS